MLHHLCVLLCVRKVFLWLCADNAIKWPIDTHAWLWYLWKILPVVVWVVTQWCSLRAVILFLSEGQMYTMRWQSMGWQCKSSYLPPSWTWPTSGRGPVTTLVVMCFPWMTLSMVCWEVSAMQCRYACMHRAPPPLRCTCTTPTPTSCTVITSHLHLQATGPTQVRPLPLTSLRVILAFSCACPLLIPGYILL